VSTTSNIGHVDPSKQDLITCNSLTDIRIQFHPHQYAENNGLYEAKSLP
jgi:hypothetical protein